MPTDSQHDGVQGGLAVGIGEMITTITALLSILIRLSNHLIPNPTTHHSRVRPPVCASRRHRRRDSVCRVGESRDTPSTLCRWGSTTLQQALVDPRVWEEAKSALHHRHRYR